MTPSNAGTGSCQLVEKLRAMIRAENYEEVLKLLPEYHTWFEQAFQSAASDPEESRRLALEARDLLGWARSIVMASRAHDQAQADRLDHAMRYMTDRNGAAPNWRVDA